MSDRRKYLLLVGAIGAALVGALLIALPSSPVQKKPTLGLDLRGGLEVVLKAVPPKGHTLTPDDMSRSISIMQNRINKLGVSEPEIRKQGNNQIVIQLAGVHDPAAAAALIGKTAQLMLFDFENDLTGPSLDVNGNPIATPSLYALLTSVQKQAAKGTPNEYYLFKTTKIGQAGEDEVKGKTIGKPTVTTKHSLVAGPVDSKEKLLRPFGGKVPADGQILAAPANTLVVSCPTANGCLGVRQGQISATGTYYYLLKYFPTRTANTVPEMTGSRPRPLGHEGGLRPRPGTRS